MRNFRIVLGLFALVAMTVFTSCEDENEDDTQVVVTYDCPSLSADIGDVCVLAEDSTGQNVIAFGVINPNCNCVPATDSLTYDCPDYQANIGDQCDLDSLGMVGVLLDDCSCTDLPPGYDCVQLQQNYGDTCEVNNAFGIVDLDCNCDTGTSSTWDCPEYQANVGYDCVNPAGEQGYLNDNCDCIAWSQGADCPGLQLNYGDSCFVNNQIGVVTLDCDCDTGSSSTWDCPGLQGNVGDDCQNGWGIISDDCDCVENTTNWDCPDLQMNFGTDCILDTLGNEIVWGALNTDCDCE